MQIKKCLWYSICGLIVLVGITLIIVEIFVLEKVIRAQAEDGIIMNDDTYGLWGVIPGDTETFTIRNFTIYNFTNQKSFLYEDSVTPRFVQVGNFLYQQKSQFMNHYYSNNNQQVHYNYWLYFNLLNESNNIHQKLNVINVGPLGFWMQLDTTQITSFAIQGFGGLFLQMNQTIKLQAIGQGIGGVFLPNYKNFQFVCQGLEISGEMCWYLWNDREYGIDQEVNLQFWAKAAYYHHTETKQCLFQHFFPLPTDQFEGLLAQFSSFSDIVDIILDDWYCSGEVCDSYNFTLQQISSANITNHPPQGSPQESICTSNKTCIGSPEIVTFLHHQFKIINPNQTFQNLNFSLKTFQTLFTPYKGLLNIGTLNSIYEIGSKYDQTKKSAFLSDLQAIFNAQSIDHSLVIWQWIKYMTNEFVLKIGRGGSRKIAGLGGVFSQAIYEVSYAFASWFLRDIYSFLTYKQIGNNCTQILNFLDAQTANKICKQIIPTNYQTYYNLIQPCLNITQYQQFRTRYNINNTKMKQYCEIDEQKTNIGVITVNILAYVANHYGCNQSFPTKKCTKMDIIVLQVFHSYITLSPIDVQGYPYRNKQSLTAASWNEQIPTFEYKYYLKLANILDSQQHYLYQIRNLFTFDKLFNGPSIQELFITQNQDQFYQKYYWKNSTYLRNYIRYVIIEVGFGGFTQHRSAEQLFFGYTDPFLLNLKQTDTMMGGDPSISPLIAFNELNMTQQQSKINTQVMFTGVTDIKKTRIYQSLFNKTFITYNHTYYDGQDIKWEMVTPWAEDVSLQGSDGFSIPPNLQQSDTPPVYISSIARFASVKYKQQIRKYDMVLRDMRIHQKALQSSNINPENKKYYQNLMGFLNSSYQGFPLFVSKNHFLHAEQKWMQLVNITNRWGNPMKANEWDDTRLLIQPYTGTAFSATIYLQSNYYFQANDILFPSYQKYKNKEYKNLISMQRMLPIVNTFRSGNMSEHAVDKYFGDLRDILNNREKVLYAGMMCIGVCFIVIVALKVKKIIQRSSKNQVSVVGLNRSEENKPDSLLEQEV